MKNVKCYLLITMMICLFHLFSEPCMAWFDETHMAIAKATGYPKWFRACGPDIAVVKAGNDEQKNHYVNNPRGTKVTFWTVLDQVCAYNTTSKNGNLYGAIVASLRNYIRATCEKRFGDYHLAYCIHYVGDLSMPLHNTLYNCFNRTHHKITDGIINDEVLDHIKKIKIDHITIDSEEELAIEIARIANLSIDLGYKLEDEKRLPTREEAYRQISHSASLLKAILKYAQEKIKQHSVE